MRRLWPLQSSSRRPRCVSSVNVRLRLHTHGLVAVGWGGQGEDHRQVKSTVKGPEKSNPPRPTDIFRVLLPFTMEDHYLFYVRISHCCWQAASTKGGWGRSVHRLLSCSPSLAGILCGGRPRRSSTGIGRWTPIFGTNVFFFSPSSPFSKGSRSAKGSLRDTCSE